MAASRRDEPNFELEAEAIDLDALKTYGLPIIIDFGSDSCIPCQQMAPVLKTMNAAMRGKAIVKFVDVGSTRLRRMSSGSGHPDASDYQC